MNEPRRRRTPLIALFAAQLFSLGGNAIALVAIPLIVLQQTGSPLAAGVSGIFATVPLVIGGALGGVLVDRFGYRASSITADVASGVTVLAIPLLDATGMLSFGALLALVFLGGLLDPPGDTAKTVLMPDLDANCSLDLGCPIDQFSAFCDAIRTARWWSMPTPAPP